MGFDPEVRDLIRRMAEAIEAVQADVQTLSGKTMDKTTIVIIIAIIALVVLAVVVLDNPSTRSLLDSISGFISTRGGQ